MQKDVNSYKGNNRLSPVIILHAIRLTLIQFSPRINIYKVKSRNLLFI